MLQKPQMQENIISITNHKSKQQGKKLNHIKQKKCFKTKKVKCSKGSENGVFKNEQKFKKIYI